MFIIPPVSSSSEIRTEAIPDVTKTWKVGQILNATAEKSVNAQDKILLRMGQSILEAKTPIAIKAGDQLKLVVKSLVGDVPVLKIQRALTAKLNHAAAQNLKAYIAQQKDLTGLLRLSQKVIDSPTVPRELKQLLTNLQQQLPSAEQATQAKTLKKIIQNSGVFLESKVINRHNNVLQPTMQRHLETPPKNLSANNIQRGFNSPISAQKQLNPELMVKDNLSQKVNHRQTDALASSVQLRTNLKPDTPGQDNLQRDIKSQLLKISAQVQSVAPELTIKPQAAAKINLQSVVNQFIKGEINLLQFSALLTNQITKVQSQSLQQALSTSDRTLLPKELLNIFSLLLNHTQQQPRSVQIQDNLAGLLKTMDLIQELKINVDGALAKITSQQLTILSREADSLLLLIFDLYLRDKTENHLIQFRLEQEKLSQDKDDSSWKVTLNFNFEELGAIQARLHLTNNKLSTVFRAETESTATNIAAQMKLLDNALSNIGFEAINLAVTQGHIQQAGDVPENAHILDEKA